MELKGGCRAVHPIQTPISFLGYVASSFSSSCLNLLPGPIALGSPKGVKAQRLPDVKGAARRPDPLAWRPARR